MKVLMDETGINRSLARITHEILEKNKGTDNLVLIGIQTRGEFLAQRVQKNIVRFEGIMVPCYAFNINYWRDDLDDDVKVKPGEEYNFQGKIVVIIDDVLFKGRTARAAMDGIMSYGRPQEIQLGVLVDRGHRELPIRADYVGKNIPTSLEEVVKVRVREVDDVENVVILDDN